MPHDTQTTDSSTAAPQASSAELLERASRVMPGGVNSPVRAYGAVGGHPPFIAGAHGARVRDVAGREYIDFVASWGIVLPGLSAERGRVVLEPGVTLLEEGGTHALARNDVRLCWAPIRGGFALIRSGWENRPCAVRARGDDAWLDFWPPEAGSRPVPGTPTRRCCSEAAATGCPRRCWRPSPRRKGST